MINIKAIPLCSYHVTYAFEIESTLYSRLNVNELLARRKCEVWSLSDCNWTRIYNHLVHKGTLNHLAKLAKWLSCSVSTYLYHAFDCMFLWCHVRVSEWIHRVYRRIRDGEDLWQWSPLEIRLNTFRQSTIPQKWFIIIIIVYGTYK